jgi:transcriptional regulator with XRE-family HTH domain
MGSFDERLKQKREARGLTQTDLAARLGISRQAIHQLENGSSKSMKPANLVAAADILRVDIRWLAIGGEEGRLQTNTSIDTGILQAILDEIKDLWGQGTMPNNTAQLARIISDGYARVLLDIQAGDIRSMIADALKSQGQKIKVGGRDEAQNSRQKSHA